VHNDELACWRSDDHNADDPTMEATAASHHERA
jgi:hypothetical protein